MANYQLTRRALQELERTYRYSLKHFGDAQTTSYMKGIQDVFSMLAENPYLGVNADYLKQNYRRYIYNSHVLYYQILKNEVIQITRIIGAKQSQQKQFH